MYKKLFIVERRLQWQHCTYLYIGNCLPHVNAISDIQWAQEPTEIAYNFNLYTSYTFNMYPYC
jgi:hypothetical protein